MIEKFRLAKFKFEAAAQEKILLPTEKEVQNQAHLFFETRGYLLSSHTGNNEVSFS